MCTSAHRVVCIDCGQIGLKSQFIKTSRGCQEQNKRVEGGGSLPSTHRLQGVHREVKLINRTFKFVSGQFWSWSVFVVMKYEGSIKCVFLFRWDRCASGKRGGGGREGAGFIMGRRHFICSRCVLTHCQAVWSGTARPGPDLSLSLTLTSPLFAFWLSSRATSSSFYPPSSPSEKLYMSAATSPLLFFFSARPEEKDDPDNGNEHIPAVGSDQLTLTSVPDRAAD